MSDKRKVSSANWHKNNREKSRAATRAWRQRNLEKSRELARISTRRLNMKKKYGVTPEQYEVALELQNHRCAICRKEKEGIREWAIDHCHTTKRFRGILCHQCNTALGLVKDNVETLQLMINYLSR